METFEWIVVIVGVFAGTTGFMNYAHRKETEEFVKVLSSVTLRLLKAEQELAELKGEPEEANMFRMIEEALGEIDHS